MVFKAKSEDPIRPIRNATGYTRWQVPSIDAEESKIFRQTAEEEQPLVEEKTEELVTPDELQAIKDKAYSEGFEKGEREGLESAKDEIDSKKLILDSMVNQLADPLKQCGKQTERELVELAFAVARQILRRELKHDPAQMIAIMRQALKLLPVGAKNVQILLHPDDASVVKEALKIDKNAPDTRWKLVEEPSMERGGCTLKTENSNVDASIDRQIAVLFSKMTGGQRAGENNANG